jgi:hypothetical protein
MADLLIIIACGQFLAMARSKLVSLGKRRFCSSLILQPTPSLLFRNGQAHRPSSGRRREMRSWFASRLSYSQISSTSCSIFPVIAGDRKKAMNQVYLRVSVFYVYNTLAIQTWICDSQGYHLPSITLLAPLRIFFTSVLPLSTTSCIFFSAM